MSLRSQIVISGLLLGVACSSGGKQDSDLLPLPGMFLTPMEVKQQLTQLSHDSLRGRLTGSPGARTAAEIIAGEMARLGLEPAGDSGYFQRVALYTITDTAGRRRMRVAPSWAALDTIRGATRVWGVNVIGRLRGSDPSLGDEHILVDGHYDHIGVTGAPGSSCRAVGADSICNGADDALGHRGDLKIAQVMTRNERPRRTVLFAR